MPAPDVGSKRETRPLSVVLPPEPYALVLQAIDAPIMTTDAEDGFDCLSARHA